MSISIFPHAASTFAGEVDALTFGLIALSGGILFLVFGLILFFGIRYREGSPYSRQIDSRGQSLLEWGWTIATLGVFLGLCSWGAFIYFRMHLVPRGAEEITVIGKQWMWQFQHSNGTRELNELHIPVGRPIRLLMTSQDVIHSFFVPAFRLKQDVLPGRYSKTWFEATLPGEFHLFCSQYCGTMHAQMRGKVIALSEPQFQKWLQDQSSEILKIGPENRTSRGEKLFTKLGCFSCHGSNSGVQAPSLKGLYGAQVNLSNGTNVLADENYLRESILNPRSKIVLGFQPIMPAFSGLVSEEDLLDLISYIKSLRTVPNEVLPDSPPIKAVRSIH